MNNKQKKVAVIVIGAVLVIGSLCIGGAVILGKIGKPVLAAMNDRLQTWVQSSPATEVAPPIPGDPPAYDSSHPEADADFPADLLSRMRQIEHEVEGIRGLTPISPFGRKLITPAELEEMVIQDFFSDYTDEEAQSDSLVLAKPGLLPADFDLKQLYLDLYSEQIAGFYDDEDEVMYVVQVSSFGGAEKLTYAHEFTHVLQDQIYGLSQGLGLDQESCEEDSERCAAVTALIEGDASLTELLWFRSHASQQDYEDLQAYYEDYEATILDSAPPYFSAALLFPYVYGQTFVESFYDAGGYARVDQVYGQAPVSTEQIMHPERYPDDTPIRVTLPDFSNELGDGWYLYEEDVMGEWYTYLILNKGHASTFQLPDWQAAQAAEGWGGDAYAFYLQEDTDRTVFVLQSVWDSIRDADEFTDGFTQYADARWIESTRVVSLPYPVWETEDGFAAFWQEGARTLWVLAPDLDQLDMIMSGLQ